MKVEPISRCAELNKGTGTYIGKLRYNKGFDTVPRMTNKSTRACYFRVIFFCSSANILESYPRAPWKSPEIVRVEKDKGLIPRITKEETFVQLIFRRSCTVGEHRTVNPYQIGSQESETLIRVHVELHRARSTSYRLFRRLNPEVYRSPGNFAPPFVIHQVFSFSLIAYNSHAPSLHRYASNSTSRYSSEGSALPSEHA